MTDLPRFYFARRFLFRVIPERFPDSGQKRRFLTEASNREDTLEETVMERTLLLRVVFACGVFS